MRSSGRRLASSVSIAAVSAKRTGKRASRLMERVTDHLGPLRDNHIYRKLLDHPATRGNTKSFTRLLQHRKTEEHNRLKKYLRRHPRRNVRRRIKRIEQTFQAVSKNWTDEEYRAAFKKAMRQRRDAWLLARQIWEHEPDNKNFHKMRVELRDLRYTTEIIAEALGVLDTRAIRTVLRTLRSLQTSMGNIHDVHKLRTELVAWTSGRPPRKRSRDMAAASELQKEYDRQFADFKERFLAFENPLPSFEPVGKILAEL